MKRIVLTTVQGIIIFVGLATFLFLLAEPHLEGRNAEATLFEIYFNDVFLACVYAASTLFFIALYKAYRLVGFMKQNQLHSQNSLRALRTIRYCMVTLITLLIVAEAYLFVVLRTKDDIAGGVVMGLFMMLVFTSISIFTTLFERHLQKGFSLSSSNDQL